MKTVIIVSKCLRVTKFNFCEQWYEFHFKGFCSGEAVKKIMLKGSYDIPVKRGEEYLLYVQLIAIESGVLKGNIIKHKPLRDCWDRS